MHLTDLVPTLQMAIGPVILISGVGLLLLSMTNRLGRVIDRARLLLEGMRKSGATERARFLAQLPILYRRAKLIRLAIIYSALSVLLAGILIISLFLAVLLHLEIGPLVAFFFVACIGCLIVSVVMFISDINLALSALRLEMAEDGEASGAGTAS